MTSQDPPHISVKLNWFFNCWTCGPEAVILLLLAVVPQRATRVSTVLWSALQALSIHGEGPIPTTREYAELIQIILKNSFSISRATLLVFQIFCWTTGFKILTSHDPPSPFTSRFFLCVNIVSGGPPLVSFIFRRCLRLVLAALRRWRVQIRAALRRWPRLIIILDVSILATHILIRLEGREVPNDDAVGAPMDIGEMQDEIWEFFLVRGPSDHRVWHYEEDVEDTRPRDEIICSWSRRLGYWSFCSSERDSHSAGEAKGGKTFRLIVLSRLGT